MPEPSPQGPLRAILTNTSWLLFDKLLRMVLVFATALIIARHLGPERFGTLSFSIALAILVMELSALGLHGIVVREVVEQPERASTILGSTWAMRLGAGLVGVTTAVLVAGWVKPAQPEVALLTALVAGGLCFRSFDVIDLWLQARDRARHGAMARSVALVLVSALRVSLVLVGAPLWGFALAAGGEYTLIAVLLLVVYLRAGKSPLGWRLRAAQAKQLLAKSWPLILSSLGVVIYLKIDQIMLGTFRDHAAVGVYAVAAQLSEAWWFIPTAIVTAAFPTLIRLREESQTRFNQRLQQLLDLLSGLGLLIAVVVTLVATPAVRLLFGAAYVEAGVVLTVHIWSVVFIFMRAALSKWIIIEDLYIFSLITQGAGALMNVALNLVLIPRYGAVGAAVATVVSYATASYLALFCHPRTWGVARMMSLALLSPLRWPLKLLTGRR